MPSLPERLRKEAQEIRESWSDMEPCDSFPHYRAHDMAQAELFDAAAAEIERLRVIVQGWEHSARNAERDMATLRAERDEARREVCEADTDTHGGALLEAERRGWECFKAGE